MQEKYYKYANLLLKKGLNIKKGQPLLIMAPIESIDFIRVLTEVATNLDILDIYYDWYDDELKHTLIAKYDNKAIENSPFWNKQIHDIYAKKDAAFLFLTASDGNVMQDIDPEKLQIAASHSIKTRMLYKHLQEENQISWCIASAATEKWSKMIFKNAKNSKEKLWELIFDICLINEEDPCLTWEKKMNENHKMCQKLTNLKIKTLHYQNTLGTDLIVELPPNAIWCGGDSKVLDERQIIANIPTEEVFTTPNKFKTTGFVYCSKPLIHQGITIDNIILEFIDGKVISFSATSGQEELKNILNFDKESNMLGEVALVDYRSKISNTNILFYETLFDENAACHIALGAGFKECLEKGNDLNQKELDEIGYNKSDNHVDIMIGTKDLTITATTYDNKEITIFKNGNFNI